MRKQEARRRAVNGFLAMTENTAIAPGPLERQLLEQYVAGALTIDQVSDQLDDPTG